MRFNTRVVMVSIVLLLTADTWVPVTLCCVIPSSMAIVGTLTNMNVSGSFSEYCSVGEGFADFGASYPYAETASNRQVKENGDKKLAQRLLDGDRSSFDAFFNGYFPRLYRFALVRMDYDHDLAEETAQVVLCQAISKMSTYRGEAPLFAWLCTFCRHEISRQLKSRGRAQGDTPLNEDDPTVRAALESLLSSSADDPDAARYQMEISRLVKVTLDSLPALYADSLESKYVHGMSVREIGDRIGKSTKATESILTRARIAFRECFESLTGQDGQKPQVGQQLSSIFE